MVALRPRGLARHPSEVAQKVESPHCWRRAVEEDLRESALSLVCGRSMDETSWIDYFVALSEASLYGCHHFESVAGI